MRLEVIVDGRWRICSPILGNKEDCTFVEFVDSLGANLQKKVGGLLAMMEQHSQHGSASFNVAQCHYVDQREQIYQYSKGRLRLFWFEDAGRVVICTHGIVKSDQRTPKREIERAIDIKRRYMTAKAEARISFVEEEP